MNICDIKGSEYQKIKTDLIRGKIVSTNEFFEKQETDFSEYFLGDVIVDGEILSGPDKIGLLNSISDEIAADKNLAEELKNLAKKLINRLLEQLADEREVLHRALIVLTPGFTQSSILRNLNVSARKSLLIADDRGKFIPILSPELNSSVTSTILSSLKEICLWDEASGIIINNNKDLTKSIQAYKNQLFSILCQYTNNEYREIPKRLTEADIDFYKTVLNEAWSRIKTVVEQNNGEINLSLDERTATNYIQPIMAFYVLQNFDNVTNQFLSDFITITLKEFSNIEASEEKYKRKLRKKNNSSFDDGFASSDGDNLEDRILDTFITSTPIGNGLYLDKKFKDNFLCVLKDALENRSFKSVMLDPILRSNLESIVAEKPLGDIDWQIQQLITLLTTPNDVTEKLGFNLCEAFGKRLAKFNEALNKQKNLIKSTEKASLDLDYNIGVKLVSQLSKGVVALTLITGNKETNNISPGTKKKSKQYVKIRLNNALSDVLSKNHRLLTDPKPLFIGRVSETGITDLYSKSAQDLLIKITGINFRDPEIIEKFSNPDGLQSLANFIKKYKEIVNKHYSADKTTMLNNNQKFINDTIDELTKTGEYIDFSRRLVEENQFEMERSFDQLGLEQARTTIATLSTSFTKCLSDFTEYVGSNSKNILVRWPYMIQLTEASFDNKGDLAKISDFNLFITFGGDVKYLDGSTARWIRQKTNEVNTVNLNQLYLYNILNHAMLTFQIDATSDKVKSPFANINLENGNNLVEKSLEELQEIYREELDSYYSRVRKDIIDFHNRIFNQSFEDSIEGLILLDEYLQNNATEQKIINAIREIQQNGTYNFDVMPQIHYCTDKSGRVFLNRSLLYEIFKSGLDSSSRKLLKVTDDLTLDNFKQALTDLQVPLLLTDNDIDSLEQDQKRTLALLFFDNVTEENLENRIKEIKEAIKTNKLVGSNPFFDHFLKKYKLLANLVRESALEIFNKHYWVHGKGKNFDLQGIRNADVEILGRLFADESTSRIDKSVKRNNSQSGTFSPMSQGLRDGVPANIRVASVGSLNTDTTNNFGDSSELHAHDGAIWSAHILRIWERISQQLMNMADNAKIIALQPHNGGFYQIKCADYSMTNSWIRNSIAMQDSNSNQFVDGKALYELMLRPAKTNQLLANIQAFIASNFDLPLLGLPTVYYNFQGRNAYLEDYDVISLENGNFAILPVWVYADGTDEEVPTRLVAETLDLSENYTDAGIQINDLFDLWKFFGAENSMSVVNGKLEFTDISQEYLAYLINDFDPELKSIMISKICDPEAVKSTPFPVNNRKEVFENKTPLVTTTIATRYYGPLQDYSHQTDEDTIPFTTQVIGAIAFNGENSELVSDLYETIGDITADALSEITDLASDTNKTLLYRKIGKLILSSLTTNGVISNAQTVLEDTLRQLVQDDSIFAKKAIALSDNELYHLASGLILSKLNKMIKQRFAGTAVVQNPAQGIIGVYQDNQGITYNKTDITKRALDWYSGRAEENKTLYRTEDIVREYLKTADNFSDETLVWDGNEVLPINKINIADNVRVVFTGENVITKEAFPDLYKLISSKQPTYNPEAIELFAVASYEFEIENPMILQQLHEAFKQGLVKELDLIHSKPRNLSTTQVTFEDETGEKTNIWLLNSTKAVIGKNLPNISIERLWHSANMKGIGDKYNPYYFKTLDDFKANVRTNIIKDSIYYRGGEEVLPKQYRRKFSIDGSMADILSLDHKHFRALAEKRLKTNPTLDIASFGPKAFALSTNNFDIIFTSVKNQVGETIQTIKEDNKYAIYTNDDQKVENISLPIDHTYEVLLANREGEKPILVIQTDKDISLDQNFANKLLDLINVNSARFVADPRQYSEELAALDESIAVNPEKIETYARQLEASFRLTTKTVSVRIPSQSFQSFLANETVLFTETEDNNGYMNLWEMWFLGSDYDIDKAYTIMFDPGENGVIEGNIFSDYSSPEKLMESLLLRTPDKRIRIETSVPNTVKSVNVTQLILDAANGFIKNDGSIEYNLDSLNNLLDTLKAYIQEGNYLVILPEMLTEIAADLVNKLNFYNAMNLDETYKKNKVMAGIRYAAQDIHNLRASLVPMIADPVNNSITRSQENNGVIGNKVQYNEDPGHIPHYLYQASIGKEGVGISANAIKDLSLMLLDTNMKIKHDTLLPINFIEGDIENTGLNLEFRLNNIDGQRTVKEKVLKLPNTPMTQLEFMDFYRPYELKLPLYNTYLAIRLGLTLNPIKGSKEDLFILSYNITKELEDGKEPSFLEALYTMQQFELNAADMMSIFISLCTDNMKELSLYKIGATPDLLNLPLAMVAVGMDIQDVTDICVQYIVPIMNELDANKYLIENPKSVEDIIKEKIKQSEGTDQYLTYQSLLKIYNVALEMKLMAALFKVNLGVSVKPTEVLEFLNRLNKHMDKSSNKKNQSLKSYTYQDFFVDNPQLAKENIQAAINNYKSAAINVVEVVTGSKHFFKQLEACYRILKILEDNVAVSHITAEISNKFLNDTRLGKTKNLNLIVQQTVQNALLTRALMSMPEITFEKSETEKFGEWNSELGRNAQVGVSTKMKVDNLLQFIEDAFIPYLQKNYSDNFFVLLLRRNSRDGRYELPFNSFEVKGDLRTKMDITKATIAFSQISSIASGLHTIDGIDISYGDLLYLYATISNQNRTNSLKTIVKEAASKGSKLNIATRISNYYAELDRLTGISTSNPANINTPEALAEYNAAKSIIDSITKTAEPYALARLSQSSIDVVDPETSVKIRYLIDENFPLYTMIPGKILIDSGGHSTTQFGWQEKFANSINILLLGYNSSAKVLTDTVTKNGELLTFNIQVPGKMGGNTETVSIRVDGIKDNNITASNYETIRIEIAKNVASLAESLSLILDDAEILTEPISINNYLEGQPDIQNAVYKTIGYDITDRNINPFVLNIVRWMDSKQKDVVIAKGAKYVKSHIDRLGEKATFILNPTDFTKRNAGYTVMNLYLDTLITDGIPTPEKRLAALLTAITGLNITEVSKALLNKDILKVIQESKAAYNWYLGYLNDSTTPQMLQTAYNTLLRLEKALTNLDLYYYDCDPSLDNEIGDIFRDNRTGENYIYLGDTDDNLIILRNINPASEDSVRLTYKTQTDLDSFTRIKKLRINSDYSNNVLSAKDPSLYKNINTTDVLSGDIITNSNGEYYISAVLYEKLPNKNYRKILLGSKDGSTLEEINIVKSVKRIPYQEISGLEKHYNVVDLPLGDLRLKSRIAKDMSYGLFFTYYSGNEILESRFKSFVNDYITTIDGKLLPINTLCSVEGFDLKTVYPRLDIDTANNYITVPYNANAKELDRIVKSITYGLPEFRYGYKYGKVTNRGRLVIPSYILHSDQKNAVFFKPFNISNDLKYRGLVDKSTELAENDTVVVLRSSDNQSEFEAVKYLVLESTKDGYIVLESKQQPSELIPIENTIKVVKNDDLINGKLYKDETRKSNVTLAQGQLIINNDFDTTLALFSYLSNKFGTRVEFVDQKDATWTARVYNGVILINRRNASENESVDYIMKEGVHEFMHLAITALKMEHPEVYLTLMEAVRTLENEGNISTKIYLTSTSQNEERLVRKLTDLIMNNGETNLTSENIENIMLLAMKELLGLSELTTQDLLKRLNTVLTSSELFKGKAYSQEEMLAKTLRDEYMDKIKYECE